MTKLFTFGRTYAVILFLGVFAVATALGGGGPENLALVVNADDPDSLRIANEYAHLRNVPEANVIYIQDVPARHTIKVDVFRDEILRPILQALNDRGLAGQVDYVAYSSGFPYRVDVRPDVGQNKLHKLLTTRASLTGLTYLYQLVLSNPPAYLSLKSNGYMRRPLRQPEWEQWSKDEIASYREVMKLFPRLNEIQKKLKEDADNPELRDARESILKQARQKLQPLVEKHSANQEAQYNLACVLALQGETEKAMGHLEAAVEAGWWNSVHTRQDDDLAALRSEVRFQELLDEMKQMRPEMQPTIPFRNTYGFQPDGRIVKREEGLRYMLSTMLAHIGGHTNTLHQALWSLRRSVGADGTRPSGSVYYMKNNDVRSRTREWGYYPAVRAFEELNPDAAVLRGKLPQNKRDVVGVMTGTARFDWSASGSHILPGAICEHLTSTGGVMSGSGQTLLSKWIGAGAAGSSGTVTEPYALQAKFPSPYIHVHYARGASLAEAFYQSVAGPYQLLIVGDPLCRPWARIPEVSVEGLKEGETVTGPVTLKPRATVPGDGELKWFELFLDGQRRGQVEPGDEFSFDTRQIADGWHEVRVVAVAGSLQTQGRSVMEFCVDNGGPQLRVQNAPDDKLIAPPVVRLSVSLQGAEHIGIYQNEREVGRVEGDSGEVEIEPSRLGGGPVRLRAFGRLPGQTRYIAGPLIEFKLVGADRAASRVTGARR